MLQGPEELLCSQCTQPETIQVLWFAVQCWSNKIYANYCLKYACSLIISSIFLLLSRQNHEPTADFYVFFSSRDLGFIDESFKLLSFLLRNLNLGIDAIFEREFKVTPQICVSIEVPLWIFFFHFVVIAFKTLLLLNFLLYSSSSLWDPVSR